jgi:Carboxypeptidase regulatory-like domain
MTSFKRFLQSSALLALVTFATTSAVWGQATTSLRGIVSDSQGGAIDSANITLQNDQTGFKRSVVTDNTGTYLFLQVPPGAYVVIVEKPGFSISTEKGVQLLVNTPATLNVGLQLASVATSVNVEAEVATINTVDAAIGNAFNQTQVRELPLQTRNVVELLSLQPGVTQTGEVLGSRRDQNNITLDGVDANDNQNAGLGVLGRNSQLALPGFNGGATGSGLDRASGFNAALPVPLDSVQEFRVTVGGEGADQGRSSGGQVTLITKSGTNRLHGSAYEFNRNTIFSANNWFNNRAGVARQPLNRNQFGFSLGGPIKKDRVFFFFNYERRLDRTAISQLSHVPSQAMRQGILTFANTSGGVTTLTPAQLKQIDPQGIGESPAILSLLQQYPVGNDPSTGFDGGLNFVGYRFNAPDNLTNNAYVGKMDFHVDSAGKHVISVRASLAGNTQVLVPQSFPGQPTNNVQLNNSRGISASYTAVLSPSMVNVATFGLTRIGLNQTGPQGTAFNIDSVDPFQNYTSRAYIRISPTYNINDDFTWTKGTHTITAGVNIRFVRNGYTNYANAWPTYSYSRSSLTGLGSDFLADTQAYLTANGMNPTVANTQALQRAGGDLLGVISSGSINYSYTQSGIATPIGVPRVRNFATNEYAGYVSDSWRIKPGLTLTAGLRYENDTPPWETNGLQVAPTFSLQDFWGQRVAGAAAGVPSFQLANAELQYGLIGPANNKPSWFARQNTNFAPRLAIAYSPDSGLGAKILGKGGVFRAGGTIAYDRFGSDMVVQFDNQNPFGLTENDVLGSFTFTSGPRYNGTVPALPAASTHTFPYTPANVAYIGGTYVGMESDLKTPYAYVFNASVARPLKGGMTLEIGYQGRLSHSLLMQQDVGGVAWNFKDPSSGITLGQAEATMRSLYLQLSNNNPNLTNTVGKQIAANPSLVPSNPFIEKYFGKIANLYFPGSATANYLYLMESVNALSDTDTVNQADRLTNVNGKSFPNCISSTGCWTFYTPQASGINTWTNNGAASYNGATITLRKPLSKGVSFDFNYTLSHSIDRGGGAESGAGSYGGIMLNPYSNTAYRGSSDFDARHNINANILYELPFGKGKWLLRNAGPVMNQIVNGWQISMISRYRSGLPSSIFYGGVFPTNFSFGAIAYPISSYSYGTSTYDQKGNPSVFSNTSAASNWLPMYAGSVGSRAAIRLAGLLNFDIAVAKSFQLPFEGQRLQLRGEAFNAFNQVNFYDPILDATTLSSFGEYQLAQPGRVMQFGLRYEF